MATIAVIGDVGGCADQLVAALRPLADDPDVVVVQVGDLVDRGPDSAGVLAVVRRHLEARPRRWVQLIGNHEAQYLGHPAFWPERLADDDARLLQDWWLREWMRVAAAVRTAEGEEFLLTHAGLTVAGWDLLDRPVTTATTADLLNTRPDELLRHDLGPLWAEAGPALYGPWVHAAEPMPFSQIHGHSTIADFRRREFTCGERVRSRSTADWVARHTCTRTGSARFIGIDPKHGRAGAPQWSPLILRDATLLA